MKSSWAVFFYNAVFLFCSPFILVFYLFRSLLRGKPFTGLGDRLGLSYAGLAPGDRPVVWIHAVSVGEVNVANPLVKALRARYPNVFILLTTVTATGRAMLQQRLPEIDATRYFPFDYPFSVQKAISAVRPSLFVSLETEIWPNFIATLKARGVPVGIVNGRISPGSFRGYLRVRWFIRRILSSMDFFAMQTAEDAARIRTLGAPPDRVAVLGNIKYDGSFLTSPDRVRKMREDVGLSAGRLWVAGSTHRGEEESVLRSFRTLSVRFPDLRLAIAPRHPERFGEVAELIAKEGVEWRRKSASNHREQPWKILLVDTMGDLPALYSLASTVFVGGSLAPVGGHNVIEPAAWGKPVLFGPHMFNFADVAAKMKSRGCGVEVTDADDLARRVGAWLESPEDRDRLGKRALEVVEENRGAVERSVELIGRYLNAARRD